MSIDFIIRLIGMIVFCVFGVITGHQPRHICALQSQHRATFND